MIEIENSFDQYQRLRASSESFPHIVYYNHPTETKCTCTSTLAAQKMHAHARYQYYIEM